MRCAPQDRGRPRRPPLDRAHLDPLPGRQERPGREDRRGRQGQADRGRLRHPRRIEPRGRARRHRPEARRHARRRAQPAVAAHAGAVELPGQHAGDPRRPARDADPARHHRELRPVPRGGDHPAHQVRAAKARDRAHILLGLVIAVTNLDEVVRIIRGSPRTRPRRAPRCSRANGRSPRSRPTSRWSRRSSTRSAGDTYRLSDAQVRAILDLRLHRLTALGRDEIGGELEELADVDRRAARDPRRPRAALRGDARRARRGREPSSPRRASPRSPPPGTGSRTRT